MRGITTEHRSERKGIDGPIEVTPTALHSNIRLIEVGRVPQHDGGHHQVEAARAIPLVLKAPVSYATATPQDEIIPRACYVKAQGRNAGP